MPKFTKSVVKAHNAAAPYLSLLECIEISAKTKATVHFWLEARMSKIDVPKKREKCKSIL